MFNVSDHTCGEREATGFTGKETGGMKTKDVRCRE